jgi:hypothetical protein
MREWRVVSSTAAVFDIDSIYNYISEQLLEPHIAANQIARLS